jgi:hypothetical protein
MRKSECWMIRRSVEPEPFPTLRGFSWNRHIKKVESGFSQDE